MPTLFFNSKSTILFGIKLLPPLSQSTGCFLSIFQSILRPTNMSWAKFPRWPWNALAIS